MATIGLKNLYIAELTKDDATGVTYEVPEKLAPAIQATITPSVNSATLFADDGPAAVSSSLAGVEVSLNIADLSTQMQAKLLGHKVNSEGVLIKNATDEAPYVALGFSAPTHDGKELFVWLYKGKFQLPEQSYATKGENVEFQTPTVTAQFVKRENDNQWQAQAKSGDTGLDPTVITNWFSAVYKETPTV
jgi:phi13 family phage major tail protein